MQLDAKSIEEYTENAEKLSLKQLTGILRYINRDEYPDRYRIVEDILSQKKLAALTEDQPKQPQILKPPAGQTTATESENMETQLELFSPFNECLVTFWVNEVGSVTFPRLEGPFQRRSRYSKEEILKAIRQWKFKPAIRDGKPASILVTQRMDLNPTK